MTVRLVIDAPAALRIVRERIEVSPEHALVAPNLLRSQALSILYREVRAGALDEREGRRLLDGIAGLRIRLLGDRVSRATAWTLAHELGQDDTDLAEYLAVARLQADALVALDPRLAAVARGVVELLPFHALAGETRA